MHLSAQLHAMLEKIVDACDGFCSPPTNAAIFEHVPHDVEELSRRVKEFDRLKKRVIFLRKRCAEHARIVSPASTCKKKLGGEKRKPSPTDPCRI
jgi:hypothetical protein